MNLRLDSQLRRTVQSLQLMWRVHAAAVILVFALTVVSAMLPLGVAYVGKRIIDSAVAQSASSTLRYVLVEALLVLLQTVSMRGLSVARTLLGMKTAIEINCLILRKSSDLALAQVESPQVQDKVNRAAREADSRPLQMVADAFQIVQNVLTLLGYIGLLVAFTPVAALVLLVAALPATIAEMRFSNKGFRLHNWRSPDRRRISYFENVLLSDSYAKEVRALRLNDVFLERYRDLSVKLFGEDRDLAIRRGLWATLLSFLAVGAFYGFYAVIARQAALGILTLGNLTLYVVALRQGQQAFQTCLASVSAMYEHNLYMTNLFDFLSIPPLTSPAIDKSVGRPRLNDKKGIIFEKVSFQYPGQNRWALRDINLEVSERESVALIGFNGAGKTTLIKLLCRLYDPTEGRILIDGCDLRDWHPLELFRRVSVVFQDFNRYQLPFGENVGIGDVEHLDDESRVHAAIEKGGARDLFSTLPEGLNTQLGRYFGGLELSGGQWQRVALSRVFMKTGADILILDEPTAALDAQAEYESLQTFRELARGKTSILISHHFPVARLAERIVVLEEGRIIEDGNHEALLRDQGRYAQLFTLQAQGFA